MIDGLQIMNLIAKHLSIVDFYIKVSLKTGELSQKQTAVYKNLFITKYPNGRIKLSGSLASFLHGNNKKDLS